MHIRTRFDDGKQINRSQGGHIMVGVLELVTAVMEELGGDRKCKASAAAKLQCKKARYSTASVDYSLSSRMAYSR